MHEPKTSTGGILHTPNNYAAPVHPDAPLFPSERIPAAVSALNVTGPGIAVTPSTFRRALKVAGDRFLTGPVTHLHPHLLRHAAATHNYERGMSLWEVQKMLGHDRPTTTVSYLATAHADPEAASLVAAGRAVQRSTMDKGNLPVSWNLRWAAARRDIWRPSDLLKAFEETGFTPSLSKVAALWSGKPISVRLDDLDKMCAALGCTVADLLEAEPLAAADGEQEQARRWPALALTTSMPGKPGRCRAAAGPAGRCRRTSMTRSWPVGQCRVCLGWGEKPQFADCTACSSWRHLHPDLAPCRRCGHDSHVNTDGLCRICLLNIRLHDPEWITHQVGGRPSQLMLILPGDRPPKPQPLDKPSVAGRPTAPGHGPPLDQLRIASAEPGRRPRRSAAP